MCLLIAAGCFDFQQPELIEDAAGGSGAGGGGGSDKGGTVQEGGTSSTGGTSAAAAGHGSGGEGGAPAPPAQGGAGTGGCDPRAPFTNITPLDELNSTDEEWGFAVTSDERVAFFTSDREFANVELWSATRTDASAFFADITNADMLNDEYDQHGPSLSSDGLTLYFSQNAILQIAKRGNRNDAFSDATELSPGGQLTGNIEPFVTQDDGSLYFSSDRLGGSGGWDNWVSGIEPSGALTPSVPVAGLNTEYDEFAPVLSADELTIYFESNRPTSGFMDSNIWVAHRSSVEEDFGEAVPVTELNLHPETEFPEAISPDSCRLYFVAERSGNRDIFVATRDP
jgi:Tol biopolymer transport system component